MLKLIVGIIIGALAGIAANKVLKKQSNGLGQDCLVGILGGLVGITLFGILGFRTTNLLGEFISSLVGSIIILYVKDKLMKKL